MASSNGTVEEDELIRARVTKRQEWITKVRMAYS